MIKSVDIRISIQIFVRTFFSFTLFSRHVISFILLLKFIFLYFMNVRQYFEIHYTVDQK